MTGYAIAPQAAIQITQDDYGDVTLVQNGVSITVSANNLATLVEILVDIIGYAPPQPPDIDPLADDDIEAPAPPTAPMSNAERQRRYRAKHKTVTKRNGGSPPDVTPELFNDATDNEADK